MGYKFALCRPDGELFGEAEYSHQPDVGDELIISGNRRVRVLAYVPVERISEFVDEPIYGVLEVEPV